MVSNKYVRDNISSTNFEGITDFENFRIINYPGVIKNMYYVSKYGQVYSIANDSYIAWTVGRDHIPYVNLSILKNGSFTLEPFYIKDLVACSFLDNSLSYLERGYRVLNIDGDTMNCKVDNIVYIK